MAANDTLPDSILLVDKARGVSSFDIIRKIRKIFACGRKTGPIRKIGHAGTLDPIATGLVIVLINGATRMSAEFLNLDKVYSAQIFVGTSTDTYDATGRTVDSVALAPDYFSVPDNVSRFEHAVLSFGGEIMQEPPMFSALKKDGSPLYKLARKGVVVDREPRKCFIYSISRSGGFEYDPGRSGFVTGFEVRCSKGTYIRSLCNDIGGKFGVPCHMSGLRRVSVGNFHVSAAVSFDGMTQDVISAGLIAAGKENLKRD